MKLPRDLSGSDLVKSLSKFGYELDHQTGSHCRLKTELNGTHSITIPAHSPLKLGTLNSILNEIAKHLKISKSELIERLFR
ncbi:type II toxin-antitoxin system HicA family toxin [bacterium]|nr:type II toxin-antitoxin system HicA family toxin [bacterium]